MWRALFYATGAMLIILGVECIVFGRFAISSDSRLNKVVNKVLGSTPSNQIAFDGMGSGSNGYGNSRASRFGDPFFSSASHSNPERAFSLPSYGGASSPVGKPSYRIVKSEDWMPWSLIAIGTIITLYTHSLQRNSSGH